MGKRILLLLLITLPTLALGQRWKRERYEWMASAGASQFLGDVGGRNQIGSDYFFDLDAASTRYVLNIGLRYKLSEYFAARTYLTYGELYGDDAYTDEPWRNNRNLHFRSPLFEWSVSVEGSWMRESTGSRYKIRRVRGRGKKGSQVYVYGFVGVGLMYMNPMAKYEGEWYSLRPLRTEGQDFVPSRTQYSNWQFVIPFGLGMKYAIDKKSSIGIEYGIRKTFTDYMDDVSTDYVWTKEGEKRWPAAAAMVADALDYDRISKGLADPSLAPAPSGVDLIDNGCSACPGQQRGDPTDLDSYMFMTITYYRKIRTGRKGLPKF
jgi:hypothetical protein